MTPGPSNTTRPTRGQGNVGPGSTVTLVGWYWLAGPGNRGILSGITTLGFAPRRLARMPCTQGKSQCHFPLAFPLPPLFSYHRSAPLFPSGLASIDMLVVSRGLECKYAARHMCGPNKLQCVGRRGIGRFTACGAVDIRNCTGPTSVSFCSCLVRVQVERPHKHEDVERGPT